MKLFVAKRVAAVLVLALIASMLCGCASAPQIIRVPVPTACEAPAELTAPLSTPRPTFVAPADPAATSALTPEGERQLKLMLLELTDRIRAWKKLCGE